MSVPSIDDNILIFKNIIRTLSRIHFDSFHPNFFAKIGIIIIQKKYYGNFSDFFCNSMTHTFCIYKWGWPFCARMPWWNVSKSDKYLVCDTKNWMVQEKRLILQRFLKAVSHQLSAISSVSTGWKLIAESWKPNFESLNL